MSRFVTMSQLTVYEDFGSQMSHVAALYAITRRTGHRIIFLDTWTAGKGLRLPQAFDKLPIEVLAEASLTDADRDVTTLEVNAAVTLDARVFQLRPDLNYDLRGLFVSYRYWYPFREEIFGFYQFKPEIAAQAAALLGAIDRGGRELVAVHVRRGDYLASSIHARLTLDYYVHALSLFGGGKYLFCVFSDDIAWCRRALGRRANVVFAGEGSAYAHMCAMSLCDHNIIANSAFSTWAALLNRNPAKKVVCPGRFLRDDGYCPYVNYAWFPDRWIPLEDPFG